MTDDDLDRHLRDILQVWTVSSHAAALDRLRMAVDMAVQVES